MTDTVNLSFSTFKEWLLHQFTHDELVEICRHGAQNGFSGITYYWETIRLHDHYHNDIWTMLEEDRDQQGLSSCLELIASFNGAKNVSSDEQYKNLLVWYASEKLAFEITHGQYLKDGESNEENKDKS